MFNYTERKKRSAILHRPSFFSFKGQTKMFLFWLCLDQSFDIRVQIEEQSIFILVKFQPVILFEQNVVNKGINIAHANIVKSRMLKKLHP